MDFYDIVKDIFDMTLIDESKFVAPIEHTRWIAFSSFFFLIPSFYAFCNQLFFMSSVLFFLFFTSFNFWRKPNFSWRRIVDRIYAKIAFSICFFNGFRFFFLHPIIYSSCIAFVSFVFFYFLSNKYCNDTFCFNMNFIPNPIWWKFHFLFHILASYVQFIVVYSIIHYNHYL